MPIEERLFYRMSEVRNASQKGHKHLFPGTTPQPIYYMPCSYIIMYFVCKKVEKSDKIVFYILLKTQRPFDTVF